MNIENLFTPGCIRTFTGKYIDPLNIDPELIDIEDIAHALSMQPRFGGHLPVFYSVAEHCVLGSEQLTDAALAFLLHDASEAYLLDLPKPIKDRLPEYRIAEDCIMSAIADKYGFPYPLDEAVKNRDAYMLRWEWDRIMIENGHTSMTQQQAKKAFINRFHELKPLTTWKVTYQ